MNAGTGCSGYAAVVAAPTSWCCGPVALKIVWRNPIGAREASLSKINPAEVIVFLSCADIPLIQQIIVWVWRPPRTARVWYLKASPDRHDNFLCFLVEAIAMFPVQPPLHAFFSSRMQGALGSTHARATGMRSKFDRFIGSLKNVSGSVEKQSPVDVHAQAEPEPAPPSGSQENVSDPAIFAPYAEQCQPAPADDAEIYWNKAGFAFLKVEGKYVKLRKDVINPNFYFYQANGRRHYFSFRNNRLFPEPTAQQLRKILTEGLRESVARVSERRSPVDIVCRVMNADPDASRRWLAQFRFDRDGPYSEMQFALHLEKHGRRPAWADKRRRSLPQSKTGAPAPGLLQQQKPRQDPCACVVSLGPFIAGGIRGMLYRDKEDPAYVIKRMKWRVTTSNSEVVAFPRTGDKGGLISYNRRLQDAKKEAALFCRYYGKDAAEVRLDKHDVYIRMLRVPGIPVHAVLTFPKDAIERYTDMLGHLNAAGIMHDDLHCGNILYDAAEKRFYPVDLSNIRTHYFGARRDDKRDFNSRGEYLWHTVTEDIKGKMRGRWP